MSVLLIFKWSASEGTVQPASTVTANEKPSHPFHSSVLSWHCSSPGKGGNGAIQRGEKEANGPALILIQDYNAFNRSPEGLAGWINHKHAFLCRKMHSGTTEKKEKKKRLIDRGEETALSGGVGWEKRGEEAKGEWKDGWQAKVLKRGDKTLASVPKERKGEDFTRWWTEGGREGWGLG